MSEASRQRWLLLHNRLEELNAKYGPVDDTLPDWLDHHPAPEDQPPAPPAWQPRRTQLPQDELVLAPGEEWVAGVHSFGGPDNEGGTPVHVV